MNTRWGAVASVSAVACAVGLSACGGFDSAASGEHLIKDWVKKYGQNRFTLKSTSCPGGVKQKTGGSFSCKTVLHVISTNTDHPGTITIHMTSGNKVEIFGTQDLHFQ